MSSPWKKGGCWTQHPFWGYLCSNPQMSSTGEYTAVLPLEIWGSVVFHAAYTLQDLAKWSRLSKPIRQYVWDSTSFKALFIRTRYDPSVATIHLAMALPEFAQILDSLLAMGYLTPLSAPFLIQWLLQKHPPLDPAAEVASLLHQGFSANETDVYLALRTDQNQSFKAIVERAGPLIQNQRMLVGSACFFGNLEAIEMLSATFNPDHPKRGHMRLEVDSFRDDPFPILQYCGPGLDGRPVVPPFVQEGRMVPSPAMFNFLTIAKLGNTALIRYLHEQHLHFPLDAIDVDGATLLMRSAAFGYPDLCSYLISRGADLEAPDIDGWTALYHAVHGPPREENEIIKSLEQQRQGRLEVISALIHAGADLDAWTFSGWTPLHELCFHVGTGYVDLDFLSLMLGMEVDPDAPFPHRTLYSHTSNEAFEVSRWRRRQGRPAGRCANPNAITEFESGSLFYTAVGDSGDPSAGQMLLDAGADPGLRLSAGALAPETPASTAMHQAVRKGHVCAVKFLVGRPGVPEDDALFRSVFVADAHGNTPLHVALTSLGRFDTDLWAKEMVAAMLQRPDEVLATKANRSGLCAIDLAHRLPPDLGGLTEKEIRRKLTTWHEARTD
ncbi:ankyrin repeat-containing domain protein [Zopfochytrium polystomum]|nr:ankyrin repeat-containing domain protein [Zopfochytrium polystomum]